jgi:hypothetical protein
MRFPPISRQFISLRTKYSPQHSVLKHPQSVFPILRGLKFYLKNIKISDKYLLLTSFLLRWTSHIWSKSSLAFKDIVLWDVTVCSTVDRYLRSGREFRAHRQGRVFAEDVGSMLFRNVGNNLKSSLRYIPGDSSRHNHRCENHYYLF